jgi:flagellar hook-associated protein 1 FlgK
MARLRAGRVMAANTATFTEAWSRLVYRMGRDTQAAGAQRDAQSEIVRQVEALREAVSGVSLDEEAASLMRFQRAYEANARYFQTVDDTLSVLLGLGA